MDAIIAKPLHFFRGLARGLQAVSFLLAVGALIFADCDLSAGRTTPDSALEKLDRKALIDFLATQR